VIPPNHAAPHEMTDPAADLQPGSAGRLGNPVSGVLDVSATANKPKTSVPARLPPRPHAYASEILKSVELPPDLLPERDE